MSEVLNWGQFCSSGDIDNIWKHFWLSPVTTGLGRGGAVGIYCVEAMDAAKNPTMHRTILITKNYLAQNVDTAGRNPSLPGYSYTDLILNSNFSWSSGQRQYGSFSQSG